MQQEKRLSGEWYVSSRIGSRIHCISLMSTIFLKPSVNVHLYILFKLDWSGAGALLGRWGGGGVQQQNEVAKQLCYEYIRLNWRIVNTIVELS